MLGMIFLPQSMPYEEIIQILDNAMACSPRAFVVATLLMAVCRRRNL